MSSKSYFVKSVMDEVCDDVRGSKRNVMVMVMEIRLEVENGRAREECAARAVSECLASFQSWADERERARSKIQRSHSVWLTAAH